jgi:hypothetical protein
MKSVQQEVDERSNLTGTNKFELLLFRLGGDDKGDFSELFGINVFKIREIVAMPTITKVAGAPNTSWAWSTCAARSSRCWTCRASPASSRRPA